MAAFAKSSNPLRKGLLLRPPSVRTATARPRIDPQCIRVGIAAPFGVACLDPFEGYGRLRLNAGCFDAYFVRVAAGYAKIDLRFDHREAALASTVRGLQVWADHWHVYTAVVTPAAVAAVDRLADFPALSINFTPTKVLPGRDAHGPIGTVFQATLNEISCVAASNFPGTYSGARPPKLAGR